MNHRCYWFWRNLRELFLKSLLCPCTLLYSPAEDKLNSIECTHLKNDHLRCLFKKKNKQWWKKEFIIFLSVYAALPIFSQTMQAHVSLSLSLSLSFITFSLWMQLRSCSSQTMRARVRKSIQAFWIFNAPGPVNAPTLSRTNFTAQFLSTNVMYRRHSVLASNLVNIFPSVNCSYM